MTESLLLYQCMGVSQQRSRVWLVGCRGQAAVASVAIRGCHLLSAASSHTARQPVIMSTWLAALPSPLIWQPPGSGNYIDIVTASLHHLQAITLTLVTSSPIHEWLFRGIFVHWHRGLQEEALKILCLITCTKNYSIRLCSETWYRTWLQLKSALNKRNYEVDFFKNYKADLRQSHLLHFVKRLQT